MGYALDGVRVVELARYISGPYCGMLLADLGAEVTKVETPAGDPCRAEGPWLGEESLYFAQMNRNKRGLSLDLRSQEGLTQCRELIREADVLIENFKPGVLEEMGFGRPALEELNPCCITVSVSGFGQTSPLRDRVAFDCIIQCLSGFAGISGDPADFPMLVGTYVVDVASAMLATVGTLAALRQREATGRGQQVDVSMLQAAFALMGPCATGAAVTGDDPPRVRNRDRDCAPADTFRARDGWVYIHAGIDKFWRAALRVMGREELLSDERFGTDQSRLEHQDDANAVVASWAQKHDAQEIVDLLANAGVPVARVNALSEAAADPAMAIADRLVTTRGSHVARVATLKSPVNLSDSPIDIRHPVPAGPVPADHR
jgi:crotonobetainyl-CoA:carnitine CoA-transferase CaiB-like acyl-CoA transferase